MRRINVIELIAQDKIKQNRIFLSPELISTFLKYWSYLGSDIHRADISLPFFHLTSDKFWHLVANPGFETAIASKNRPRSLEALRKAVNNECLLVIDTSTPSCGDSRFGCWVCTLVNKDKSMAAMIQNDDEKEWMQPLLDLRNELDVRDDYDRRDFRRMSGNIQLVSSIFSI